MRAVLLAVFLAAVGPVRAQDVPVTRPADGKLPHIQVDVEKKQVRIECDAVIADTPLEFLL
ncbi:MAG: hypothetical protein ABSH20_28235, partial [Tepidisphaeraceae bacterium]